MGILGSLGTSLVGGLGGSIGNIYNAYKQEKNAREMQQRQIDWERERAQNAHQWEVQDLKNAGLNPILSAGGSGATTGGISAPVADTSGYGKAGDSIISGITSATEVKRQAKDAELIDAEIEQKGIQNSLIAQQTITEAYRKGLISQQTAESAVKAQLMGQQTKQVEQLIEQQKQRFTYELSELEQKINLLKAQGRTEEAKAVQEEYNAKHVKFTYWNSQVNTITKSIQNTATAAASVIAAVNPGKLIAHAISSFNKPKGYERF